MKMIIQQQRLLLSCFVLVSCLTATTTAWTTFTPGSARLIQAQSRLCHSSRGWATANPTSSTASTSTRLNADQWDDEESSESITPLTYDDAQQSLLKRKEDLDMEGMSDEAVPGSEAENQEALRNAVRARTMTLGMDAASQEATQQMAARAAQRAGSGPGANNLDLSQITGNGFDKLSINYDPEDEMTEEEMRAADPLGFKPVMEQYLFELKESTFPNLGATLSKVALLIVLGLVTGFLIITTDKLVRDFYVSNGMLPSPESVQAAQQSGLEMAQELGRKVSSSLPDLAP